MISSITKLSLSLTVLGQIKSSNFFSFFNLLLVGLNLGLKLINESLHTFMVFTVFIRCISQFLDTPFRFTQVLLTISHSSSFSINLRLKLPDSSFHLIHGLLSTLKGIGFSFIQTSLHVLGLTLQQFSVLKGGKKAMNKMETRIRELESEVDAEARRMA